MRSRRGRTPLAVAAVAGLLVSGATLTGAAGSAATAASPGPALTLEAASSSITLESYDGTIYGDLGVFAVAGKNPFEVQVRRTSYDKPLAATLVRPGGNVALPAGTAAEDFTGLNEFYRTVVKGPKGKTVIDRTSSFCPGGYGQVRRRPDAPASSDYPQQCNGNPYSLGAIYGLQAGWATRMLTTDYRESELKLKPGTYSVDVDVTPKFRGLLGMTAAQGHAHVDLTVVKADDGEGEGLAPARRAAGSAAPGGSATPAKSRPTSRRMTAGSAKAAGTPMPDLQTLPAWGIQMVKKRYLAFSATVWNAGPSQLVVDGFLQDKNRDLMDAYQYFFDASGKQVGYRPVGTMEWDDRDGHTHWHFTDFASYRLLDSNKKLVVRSQKEAFCLANTDAVDYLVPNANWNPDNTDLHTACGDRSSVAVREVLETGSGDTYEQWRPGQSFDTKGLPNGTYYVQVLANPENKLAEGSTANNASYRKVILGGTTSHHTVTVPQVGVIHEPTGEDEGEHGH